MHFFFALICLHHFFIYRETLDPPVLKASKVFQVLRDLLVNLVKRVLWEPPENLVPLDVPEPVESVVTQEKEDLLESKDPKVKLFLSRFFQIINFLDDFFFLHKNDTSNEIPNNFQLRYGRFPWCSWP